MSVNVKPETDKVQVEEKASDEVPADVAAAWNKIGKEEPDEDTTSQDETEKSIEDTGEPEPETKTETDISGEKSEPKGGEVPDRLVQAGRRAQMTDEVIVELATNSPKVLEQLADAQDKLSADYGELGRKKQDTEEKSPPTSKDQKQDSIYDPIKLDLDPSVFDEETISKIVKPFEAKINQLTAALKTNNESAEMVQAAQSQSMMVAIDRCFDSHTEAHPELGNSDSLTAEQQEQRVDILTLAEQKAQRWNSAHSDKPMSLESAIDKALGMLKTDNAAEQKVADRLDKNKKLFTSRPTSHQKNAASVKDGDKALNAVKQYAELHDIDNLK